MISITVDYLTGCYRANSGEALAGSSGASVAEFPPSPSRLFAALTAGGGTGDNNSIGSDDSELRLLETATPPLIAADAADGPDAVLRSELAERFVVIDKPAKSRVQEYAARNSGPNRPGARVSLRTPTITYFWPELEPSEEQFAALVRRGARVGYLGCADSPVRLRVNRTSEEGTRKIWRPLLGERVPTTGPMLTMGVPYEGYLDALDRQYAAFRSGQAIPSTRLRRHKVHYHHTDKLLSEAPSSPSCIWLRFPRSVTGRRALAIAQALQGAILSHYENLFDTPPDVLHGHGISKGEQHARFIPLPDVHHRHATGRLHGAVIWLPPGTDAGLASQVSIAAHHIQRLTIPGGHEVRVELHDPSIRRPWAAHPQRWTQPSTQFATALPAVFERYTKMTNPLDEISRWCRHAGVAEPVHVALSHVPFVHGPPRFQAAEVWRKSSRTYPFTHLRLSFAEPQTGPLVIGRGRTHGFGLLVPLRDEATNTEKEPAT